MQKKQSIQRKLLKTLGLNIKYYRTKLNMTQEQLAFECGLERSYITALENGSKSPSLYCLAVLSNKLKVQLKELVDIAI